MKEIPPFEIALITYVDENGIYYCKWASDNDIPANWKMVYPEE